MYIRLQKVENKHSTNYDLAFKIEIEDRGEFEFGELSDQHFSENVTKSPLTTTIKSCICLSSRPLSLFLVSRRGFLCGLFSSYSVLNSVAEEMHPISD